MTAQTDLTERAALFNAEHCSVPCLEPLGLPHQPNHRLDCLGACKGTGEVWPLREPCPRVADLSCDLCEDRDWLPISDMETVLAAIRAQGWRFRLTQYPDGDMVQKLHGRAWEVLVFGSLRLFGSAVLNLALARTNPEWKE